MRAVTLNLPETVFSALRMEPEEFVSEMRVAAAIKWYETGRVSQGKGAEIAGLSRAEFITSMSNVKVSPFQYAAGELQEELLNVD